MSKYIKPIQYKLAQQYPRHFTVKMHELLTKNPLSQK